MKNNNLVKISDWLTKWWQKSIAAGLAILIVFLGYSAFVIIPLISTAKSYLNEIKGGASFAQSSVTAEDLNSKVDKLFRELSLPVVKQVLGVFGLDFTSIRNEINSTISAAPLLASDSKPQKFLIAFQNSAEARGTGGILGAFAVVDIIHGHIKVVQTGSNATLHSLTKLPIAMPQQYLRLYGNNPSIWQNANLSPHFPYGAQMWLALWEKQFGQKLDGAIAVDPIAVSHILKATGPVKLKSGEEITSSNVVYKTLSKAYQQYATDNNARKQYLVNIMNATINKLSANQFSKVAFAKAVRDSILENRILVYSTNARAELVLSTSKLGGALNLGPNNEYRAVIQNIDASKLDYYLDRAVSIRATACSPRMQTQVNVLVKNSVTNAQSLPAYVLTRADKGKPATAITGAHRFKLFIYGPVGAKLVSASRSSTTGSAGGGSTERGRPILVSDIDLSPGASETIIANFSGGNGKLTFVDQPLVKKTKIKISGSCGA
ncbi:MAG: DUF4012 domain-containing protein [Actinobacteria bacterium]|nr:DUF4012 domain-containing protein [Actinomycetota bacterium]